MAAHGACRLAAMAENAINVVAIELLAAAQGCDFHAPMPGRSQSTEEWPWVEAQLARALIARSAALSSRP